MPQVSKTEFHMKKADGTVEEFPKGFPKADFPSEYDNGNQDHLWTEEDGEIGEDMYLESLTVVELKELASEQDVDLTGITKKHDIIDAIVSNQEGGSNADDD